MPVALSRCSPNALNATAYTKRVSEDETAFLAQCADLPVGRRAVRAGGGRADVQSSALAHPGARDEPACRPGSVSVRLAAARSATIHLGLPLPTASCGLPASSGGPPSSTRAKARSGDRVLFLTLLRAGFTEPLRSPGTLVVSYTTVSPLPSHRGGKAVCFLWHGPAGHPGWVLPTALPCGARTFLDESPRRGRPAGSSASSVGRWSRA